MYRNRAALSIGALLGDLEGSEERVKWGCGNGASLSMGTCREVSFAGSLKEMYRKAVETGVFLHRGPVGGPRRGTLLYRGL